MLGSYEVSDEAYAPKLSDEYLMTYSLDELLARLGDDHASVRGEALRALAHMRPQRLAPPANAVVARLEDSEYLVRRDALMILSTLDPETLAEHADAVVARLEDSYENVR